MIADILYLEDDSALAKEVKNYLKKEKYNVLVFANALEGIEYAKKTPVSLILFELNLGGFQGTKLLQIIKSVPSLRPIPAIALSKSLDSSVRIDCFNSGADDYIFKPFLMQELEVHINAVLRRTVPGSKELDQKYSGRRVITAGPITLDLERYDVLVNNRKISLSMQEFELLHMLIKNGGNVVSRNYVIERVWGYDYHVSQRSVDVYIRRLRVKLGKRAGKCVETRHKLGYSFNAPITSKRELPKD